MKKTKKFKENRPENYHVHDKDARCRRKMMQENAGERRRTQGDAGRRSDETRTQDTGETQGRRRVDAVIPGRVVR